MLAQATTRGKQIPSVYIERYIEHTKTRVRQRLSAARRVWGDDQRGNFFD
jgi:hypothetical protein